jgi:vancomycin resistance protein YoaR
MLYCPVRLHWLVCCAAFFGAILLFWPSTTHALTAPSDVTLSTGSFVQVMSLGDISSWYRVDLRFALNPSRTPEFEDTEPACEPFILFCAGFLSRATQNHIILSHSIELVPAALARSVTSFAEKADRDPINARLTVDGSKIIIATSAIDGFTVDTEKSIALLERSLRETTGGGLIVTLASTPIPAALSAQTLSKFGITELIGTATTNFRGSPKNRIYNIQRAIQDFDGIVIEPGATFSFVDYLGEVDGEHGYLPELVIKNNKTEPEFGGGICQVSTTVFRAALQSGLKITERKNHAYPVQYYRPYGLDATIYIPKPDLKFVNNTPGAILIIPEIDGTLLTFSMYGTRDSRKVTIDGPHILESNPDGSMKTVFTQTVTNSLGEDFINDTFWSNYKSPSLFPHPGDEPNYTSKPKGWSEKQWREYRKIHP